MNYLVSTALLESTFYLKVGEETATCFTMTKGDTQYLVTTGHILSGKRARELVTVQLYHDKQWKDLSGELLRHPNDYINVAVIKLPFTIAPKFEISNDAKILYGQDVYFFGFPFGLHTENSLNRNFPYAFIKKAVFSSVVADSGKGTIYFLDGHNNKGFFGGPVGYFDATLKKNYIVGVVSGYVPDVRRLSTPTGNFFYEENSGIIVSFCIKHVEEIIRQFEVNTSGDEADKG